VGLTGLGRQIDQQRGDLVIGQAARLAGAFDLQRPQGEELDAHLLIYVELLRAGEFAQPL
jgi:hypothetical protein